MDISSYGNNDVPCIYSFFDCASPLLALMPDKRLGRLKKKQNEAVKISLGFPLTTMILDKRKELDLAIITEVSIRIGIRMLIQRHTDPCTSRHFFQRETLL